MQPHENAQSAVLPEMPDEELQTKAKRENEK